MSRHTLTAALGIAMVLAGAHPGKIDAQDVPKAAPSGSVNINTASLDQLQELPGIGPATAQAIIDARPFQSIDDLERVKGIGAARLESLRDRVTVAATTTTTKTAMPREAAKATTTGPASLININTASLDQLQELPGVGPATAQDIIEARPFTAVDDLERVKGIGAARLASLRDRVTVAATTTTTRSAAPRAPMPREAAPAPASAPAAATSGAININTATQAQLEELPGVGPAIAQAIIDARPFRTVDDLENVRGLGPARVGAIRDLVTVTGSTTTTSPTATRPSTSGGAMKKPATTTARKSTRSTLPEGTRINVNTASREELERLPLIGPVKAQAIIDARPFPTVDSLKDVKGIGDVTMERIRPFVVTEN